MIELHSSLPVASLRRLETLCTRFEEGQSASDRDHLASVERRARRAEFHEQDAQVRAADEVKHRRVQTLTAFAISAVSIC